MKWFKHDTDCDRSEGLSYLIDQEGFAGYGRWFRLLEIVAEKMDSSNRCHAEYSVKKWCSLLGLKPKTLRAFFELTQNKLKTNVVGYDNELKTNSEPTDNELRMKSEFSELIIKIEIPNLLKKRDDYSKKSGQNSDKLPTKSSLEVDTDKEVRSKKEEDTKSTSPLKAKVKKEKKPKTDIPPDFGISEKVRFWAKAKGHSNLEDHLESFKRKVAAKGYQYVDWDSAFMEAIRENWAKINNKAGPQYQNQPQPRDAAGRKLEYV